MSCHTMHCGPGFSHAALTKMLHNYGEFMPYDLAETDDTYIITMPLPGFTPEQVNVMIAGQTITIEATPEEGTQESPAKEPKRLISMGDLLWNRKILVNIPVDEEIEENKVKAQLKLGLLKVEFQKQPKKKK